MSKTLLSVTGLDATALYLYEMEVKEDFNGLTESVLICQTAEGQLDAKKAIGQTLFWWVGKNVNDQRIFSGIVTQIESLGHRHNPYNGNYYKITLANPLAPYQHTKHSRSWMNVTVIDVIKDVFRDADITFDFSRCYNKHEKIEYIVQYDQSDYSFLQTLCHEHGLFYFLSTYEKIGTPPQTLLNVADHYKSYDIKTPFMDEAIDFVFGHEHRANDLHQQRKGVSHVTSSSRVAANCFAGDDYNPEDISLDLSQQYQTSNNASQAIGPISLFPLGDLQFDAMQAKVHQMAQRETNQASQWCYVSEDSQLMLGTVVSLKGVSESERQQMPESILPIQIVHRAKDYSQLMDATQHIPGSLFEPDDASQVYYNKATAVPWLSQTYLPKLDPKHQPELPMVLTGVVAQKYKFLPQTPQAMHQPAKVPDKDLLTDELGRVKVYMSWDANNPDQDYDFCPWVRVLHRQNGMLYTPRAGDEVLLSPVNNRADRFVIIGSAYNSNNTVPLNIADNNALSGIKTSSDEGFNPHYLYSNHQIDQEEIVVKSSGDYYQYVGDQFNPKPSKFATKIAQTFYQFVDGDMTVTVRDGEINIKAEKAIMLEVNGTKLQLLSNAANLYGDAITLNTLFGPTGELVTKGDNHICPKRNDDLTKHKGGPVLTGSSNVFFADKPAARVGDQAKCHGPKDTITQGNYGILINGQPAAIINSKTKHGGHISSGVSNITAAQALNLGLAIQPNVKNYDVQVRFIMAASDAYRPVITHAMLNIDAVQPDELSDASAPQQVQSHLNNPTNQLHGKTVVPEVKGGRYNLRLSPESRELAIYNVNGQPQFPYYRAQVDIPNSPNPSDEKLSKKRIFDCKVLWPLMVMNCRTEHHGFFEAAELGAQTEVDPLDIQYFQNNGNNVTVFIHGYNVPLGELGNEASEVEYSQDVVNAASSMPNTMDVNTAIQEDKALGVAAPEYQVKLREAPYKSSIWRDLNIVSRQLKTKVDPDLYGGPIDMDNNLNGSGAMNWFVNMEKNINQAAGFNTQHPEDYDKYTRMLHVTWSGNWGQASYGEAVDQALSIFEARRLAKALVQLKEAGLEVNIIAHSLGNGFLLKTMQVLAQEHQGIVMDHVFMWEAAVPNDVFNRPKPKNNQIDRWDFKDALKAMNKITVLHSYNDNILGPFPTDDQQKADLHKVYKAKPLSEWFSAYMCRIFKLESLYNVAMALSVETELVLKEEVQDYVYQYLVRNRPDLIAEGGNEQANMHDYSQNKYMPTFAEQVDCVMNEKHIHPFDKQISAGLIQLADDWKKAESHLHIYLGYHPYIKKLFHALAYTIELHRVELVAISLEQVAASIHYAVLAYQIAVIIFKASAVFAAIAAAPEDDGTSLGVVDELIAEIKKVYEAFKEETLIEKKTPGAVKAFIKIKSDGEHALSGIEYLASLKISRKTIVGAAYLTHMLTDKRLEAWHVPAMGYKPLDKVPGYLAKKMQYVNQTKWLYQHSDMKIPSKDMMSHVYQGYIMNKSLGMKHFGQYSLS